MNFNNKQIKKSNNRSSNYNNKHKNNIKMNLINKIKTILIIIAANN